MPRASASTRGRRPGYQNYTLEDQMLLCAIVEKVNPIGRNMWEEVAVIYNSKRNRKSPDRDYDSLRRKFKNLYIQPKPTGSNGAVSGKMKAVRYAQEIQVAIERAGGTITVHDGPDDGEDDENLGREVAEALGSAEIGVGDDNSEQDDNTQEHEDAEEQAGSAGEEDGCPAQDPSSPGRGSSGGETPAGSAYNSVGGLEAFGSIVTSRGVFDASLGDDVYSSEDDTGRDTVVDHPASDEEVTIQPIEEGREAAELGDAAGSELSPSQFGSEESSCNNINYDAVAFDSLRPSEDSFSSGIADEPTRGAWKGSSARKVMVAPIRQGLRPMNASSWHTTSKGQKTIPAAQNVAVEVHSPDQTTVPTTPASKKAPTQKAVAVDQPSKAVDDQTAKARGAGRPRTTRKDARPTFNNPDGLPLTRDPSKRAQDAVEADKYDKLSVTSNRLGGCDLRVLRDNLSLLHPRPDELLSKRSSSGKVHTGSSFVANKRQKGRKKVNQLDRDLAKAEEQQKAAASEMMQMLMFFRQDTTEKAEADERRRRADREEKAAAEKMEREEREKVRREEYAAAETRQRLQLEMMREEREEREKRERTEAEESRRRYEEKADRERLEARQRHEEMMLMLAGMQQGMRGSQEAARTSHNQASL